METGKGLQTISEDMIRIIKKVNRYYKTPYQTIYGHSVIGLGHKIKKNEELEKISKVGAEKLLREELKTISKGVRGILNKEIPQNHFDVFCHIAYDYSISSVRNSTLAIKYLEGTLNNSEISHIMTWSKIKGVYSKALLHRRSIDTTIFTKNKYEVKK